jgi:hypothetical protein
MDARTRLRAGDRDRDQAIAALREHHAEGRLDFPEFLTRMERAQTASFLDELPPLFADLPAATQDIGRVIPARRRPARPQGLRGPRGIPFLAIVVAALFLPVVAVLLVFAHVIPFWLPLIVLGVLAHRRQNARPGLPGRSTASSSPRGHLGPSPAGSRCGRSAWK